MERDPNRLSHFYREIWLLHKKFFPNLRIGQLFSDFFQWVTTVQGKDCYYMEEGQLLAFLTEYAAEMRKKF